MDNELIMLDDDELDSIVGGKGTYMNDLSGFLFTNERTGKQYFKVSISREGDVGGHFKGGVTANDANFERLIAKAAGMGANEITLEAADSSTHTFTLKQLKAML